MTPGTGPPHLTILEKCRHPSRLEPSNKASAERAGLTRPQLETGLLLIWPMSPTAPAFQFAVSSWLISSIPFRTNIWQWRRAQAAPLDIHKHLHIQTIQHVHLLIRVQIEIIPPISHALSGPSLCRHLHRNTKPLVASLQFHCTVAKQQSPCQKL